MTAVAVAGVIILSRDRHPGPLFQKYHIHFIADSGSGRVSMPVKLRFQIGRVKEIELSEDAKVKVTAG